MLDLFTIFTKGGIVLFCIRATDHFFAPSVNNLIRNVILQVRVSIFLGVPRFLKVLGGLRSILK